MKLEWSPWALKDRDAIFDFIEQDNPRAAIEIDTRIAEQTQRLLLFPESGRIGRCAGTREQVINRPPISRPIGSTMIASESCGCCMRRKAGRKICQP